MIRMQRLGLGISLLALGLVCYAWGAEAPRSESAKKDPPAPTTAQLLEKIAALEQRISRLEQGREKVVHFTPATQPAPLPEGAHDDDDWKSRATGSRVVNGMRVYFLPLSQRKD